MKAEEELVEKVRKSIDLGVKYLLSAKTRRLRRIGKEYDSQVTRGYGRWSDGTLSPWRLLNSGEKPDDPRLVKALEYLRNLKPHKTYVVALQNLVFAEARQPKDLPLIKRNADWLIANAIGYNNGAGKLEGWSYPANQISDNSNTQYALLGLYAAKQAGVQIDDKMWKAIQEYYIRTQIPVPPTSGRWSYYNDDGAISISMTVAGACGLIIAGMGLDESEQHLNPATGVAANCGVYGSNTALAKGMNYIGANFTFNSDKSSFYNIYGLERLGRLSGQRFIDRYDWYREGCEKLIKMQRDGETADQGSNFY